MDIFNLVRVEVGVDIEVVVEEDTTVETMVDIVVVVVAAVAMTDIDVRPHHTTGVMIIGGDLDLDLTLHVSYYLY